MSQRFKYYGGRGITVCDRWRGENGFVNFLADMGERANGTTLDRVDPNGHYEPGNCRWADNTVQKANKRNVNLTLLERSQVVWLALDGGMSNRELADAFDVPIRAISSRVREVRRHPERLGVWIAKAVLA